MSLREAFRETCLPRDIVNIIINYVERNRYPHEIIIINKTERESQSLTAQMPFKDNIIVSRGRHGTHTWFNIDTLAGGALRHHGYIAVISRAEYLTTYQRAVYKENIYENTHIAEDFEGIIS